MQKIETVQKITSPACPSCGSLLPAGFTHTCPACDSLVNSSHEALQLYRALYDAEELASEPEPPTPACRACSGPLEWDTGDSDVGLPGYWWCPECEPEG